MMYCDECFVILTKCEELHGQCEDCYIASFADPFDPALENIGWFEVESPYKDFKH